jgi:hypothetical protein
MLCGADFVAPTADYGLWRKDNTLSAASCDGRLAAVWRKTTNFTSDESSAVIVLVAGA